MKTLLDLMATQPACAAQHFGPWMVEPGRFMDTIRAIEQGMIEPQQAAGQRGDDEMYVMEGDLAIVPIHGFMMKGRSSFGGTSTVETRSLLRALASDPDVGGIMLHVDSPGGTAAGTSELADDVAAAARRKPVHAHADDMMASAAAFAGLQARRVTANAAGVVGSFGTVARLMDFSKKAEQDGIKVHVISTGPFKGAFTGGAPIPDEHLAYAKEMVESMNQPFLQAVQRGRADMSKQQARDLFYGPEGGKVWSADRAAKMGIIDAVESFDAAMNNLADVVTREQRSRQFNKTNQSNRSRTRMSSLGLDLAE